MSRLRWPDSLLCYAAGPKAKLCTGQKACADELGIDSEGRDAESTRGCGVNQGALQRT